MIEATSGPGGQRLEPRAIGAVWGAWVTAQRGLELAPDADRLAARTQRRHPAALATLPDGAFILTPTGPALWWGRALHPFTPAGYQPPVGSDPAADAVVLTPRCTIATLRAGYRPILSGLIQNPR